MYLLVYFSTRIVINRVNLLFDFFLIYSLLGITQRQFIAAINF